MATIAQLLAGNTVGQLKSQTSARLADWWKRFTENTIINEFADKVEDKVEDLGEKAEWYTDIGTGLGAIGGGVLGAFFGDPVTGAKVGSTVGAGAGSYAGTKGAQSAIDSIIDDYEGYAPLQHYIDDLGSFESEMRDDYIKGKLLSTGLTQYGLDPSMLQMVGIKTPTGNPADWSTTQKMLYNQGTAPSGNVAVKDFTYTPGSELQFSPGSEAVLPSDVWKGYTTDAAKNISSLDASATINPDYAKSLQQTPKVDPNAAASSAASLNTMGAVGLSLAPTILNRLIAGGWESPWSYQVQRGRNNLRY